jgi:Arc/MetJ family transcription regulator
MRTNVVLDDELVREAFRLTGLRTKRELIHTALQELVRVRRKKDLTELAGRIRFREDFDRKSLRAMRHGSR